MKRLQFHVIMSELGAGTRGASLGYAAMLTASHNAEDKLFNEHPVQHIDEKNEELFNDPLPEFAKRIPAIRKVYENIADALVPNLQTDVFPVVIAGAHSTAAGTIHAIRKAHPEKRLGVLWIDAHADLHSPRV